MRMNLTVLAGLFLLILENGAIHWFIPGDWSGRLMPHLTFIMTIYVACFAGRHRAFFYGLGFGLLSDVLYYGDLIGPYGFGIGLIGYAAGLALERKSPSLTLVIGLTALGSAALGTIVYLIYLLFRLTQWTYSFAFYWYIAPNVLLETLVALALYMPVRKWLLKPSAPTSEEAPS